AAANRWRQVDTVGSIKALSGDQVGQILAQGGTIVAQSDQNRVAAGEVQRQGGRVAAGDPVGRETCTTSALAAINIQLNSCARGNATVTQATTGAANSTDATGGILQTKGHSVGAAGALVNKADVEVGNTLAKVEKGATGFVILAVSQSQQIINNGRAAIKL